MHWRNKMSFQSLVPQVKKLEPKVLKNVAFIACTSIEKLKPAGAFEKGNVMSTVSAVGEN